MNLQRLYRLSFDLPLAAPTTPVVESERSDFDAYVEDAELDAARTEVEDRAQQAYYDHDHNYWP